MYSINFLHVFYCTIERQRDSFYNIIVKFQIILVFELKFHFNHASCYSKEIHTYVIDDSFTFTNTIGVSEDGTFFNGSKSLKHHTNITFAIFFRDHPHKQFSFWNKTYHILSVNLIWWCVFGKITYISGRKISSKTRGVGDQSFT